MVSIAQTSKKYRGKKAASYDAVRKRQQRWALENEAVARMLRGTTGAVLDVPCGTGRFFSLYFEERLTVTGVDISEEMLALARRKVPRGRSAALKIGDATNLRGCECDVAVCVRFLDLIDEEAMRKVVTELCGVARNRIVLTIRLGTKYVPKVNTATHDSRKFNALVTRLGWCREEVVPIFEQGWVVMQLGRRATW